MGIKIVRDSNAEYHSSELLGTSSMVAGYDSKTGEINLAKVKAYMDGMGNVSTQLQKVFDFGSVQHSAILEQDLSCVKVLPKFEPIPGVTKKEQVEKWKSENPDLKPQDMPEFKPIKGTTAKEQIETWKSANEAEYYINQAEYELIHGAFDVLASNPSASQMVSNALDIETSFYDVEVGLKCRPDVVGETDNGGLFICNYKTIADLSKCDSHTYHLKYDLRAIQEIEIVQRAYKRLVDHYFFLFQEKSAPFSMRCIEISELDREFGQKEYDLLKNTVLMAHKNNYFPQPPFRIEQSKVYRSPQLETF